MNWPSEKLVVGGEWWILAAKNAKGAKRDEDSDFLCLDKAEVVTFEVAWAAKELVFRFRHGFAVFNLELDKFQGRYHVGDLEKLVSFRSYGLCKLNGKSRSGLERREQHIRHRRLTAVVVNLESVDLGMCLYEAVKEFFHVTLKTGNDFGGWWVAVGTPPKWRHPQVEGGGRRALWDLETTMTTFNNNFILRASLELADGKTSGSWLVGSWVVVRGSWVVVRG